MYQDVGDETQNDLMQHVLNETEAYFIRCNTKEPGEHREAEDWILPDK